MIVLMSVCNHIGHALPDTNRAQSIQGGKTFTEGVVPDGSAKFVFGARVF